jgi:seryl-tRNA synthetase
MVYFCKPKSIIMLSLAYLREKKEDVIKRLQVKNFKNLEAVDQVLELDQRRRTVQKELDDTLAQSNTLAKQVGQFYKEGRRDEGDKVKAQTSELKEKAGTLEEQLRQAEKQLQDILLTLPNLPHASVPKGTSAEDNEVVHQHGKTDVVGDDAVPHWDLARKYDLIDFEMGNKVTGAGFPFYKGKGAKLQRALINYFLDEAAKQGYLEVEPPILVNEDTGYGTGQLPDKEGQMYYVGLDNLYLIPTAEVPLTNMYRDVIVRAEEFPIKLTGYTPCFRREAGSYGKDVRGLNRLHQFDKVEIVQIVHPERSYQVLEDMRHYVAGLIETLGLPYRTLKLCGGDMGFASAMTYDMEVYSAAQKKWLEVSSVSNFETFQSNRLKLRFKDESGKIQMAHTLNGSALALPRIVAAILENNQAEGGIRVPEVLRRYTGFDVIV